MNWGSNEEEVKADVCLLLEGTYPYVRGGVSTWVHQAIEGMPDLTFAIFFIGAKPEERGEMRYDLPHNVVAIEEAFLFGELPSRELEAGTLGRRRKAAMVDCLRAVFLAETQVLRDEAILHFVTVFSKLRPGQFTYADLWRDPTAWQFLRDLYTDLAEKEPFATFYWTLQGLTKPLWNLLVAMPKVPSAKVYHSVCTGYAGLLGVMMQDLRGAPFILSEHGIYVKERIEDLRRSRWLPAPDLDPRQLMGGLGTFRMLWAQFFRVIANISYQHSQEIVSLFQRNVEMQIQFGAPAEKISIIPNGIDPGAGFPPRRSNSELSNSRVPTVGFLGRIVPIKDVKTLLRSASFVVDRFPDVRFLIAGPWDEDKAYYEECLELGDSLGIQDSLEFPGTMARNEFLAEVDLVILSSISEGLPFVILEAWGSSLPCVVTDVGACREMVGSLPGGHSDAGIICPVGDARALGKAMVSLLKDSDLAAAMGDEGNRRARALYSQESVLSAYRKLYEGYGTMKMGDSEE